MRIKELIVYRNLKQDKLLSDMAWLMEHFDDDYYNLEDREDWTRLHIMDSMGICGIAILPICW